MTFFLRSERSKEKMEKIFAEKTLTIETQRNSKAGLVSNQNKLNIIEDKIKMFGGLEEMEEEFIKDITTNNQRLDAIINSIKGIMKIDPKVRKMGVSPMTKNCLSKPIEKDKTSKKLIERVEKAIYSQSQQTYLK